MLQLRSGDGGLPPAIRNLRSGGEKYNIRNDGTPEIVEPPFTVKKLSNGTFAVQIRTSDRDDLGRLLANVAAATGLSVEALKAQLLQRGTAAHVARRPGPIHHQFSFGGPEALRSMVKASLVLWTTLVGNEEVRSEPYEKARRFVIDGGEEFVLAQTNIDYRYLPYVELLRDRFGPLFNLIYLRSDGDGKVIAHFTLYNFVGWRVVLAGAGGGSKQKRRPHFKPAEAK